MHPLMTAKHVLSTFFFFFFEKHLFFIIIAHWFVSISDPGLHTWQVPFNFIPTKTLTVDDITPILEMIKLNFTVVKLSEVTKLVNGRPGIQTRASLSLSSQLDPSTDLSPLEGQLAAEDVSYTCIQSSLKGICDQTCPNLLYLHIYEYCPHCPHPANPKAFWLTEVWLLNGQTDILGGNYSCNQQNDISK